MEVGDGEGKKQEDRKGPYIATALPEAPPSAHHGLGADAQQPPSITQWCGKLQGLGRQSPQKERLGQNPCQ